MSEERLNRVEITLERVVTMMANNETRWSETSRLLEKLTDGMVANSNLSKEVNQLAGDIRALRHDMRNYENSMQALPILNEKTNNNAIAIASLEIRVDNLENSKLRQDTEIATYKKVIIKLWALVGGLVTIGLAYLKLKP